MQFPELKWPGHNRLIGDLKMKQVDESKQFPRLNGKSPEEILELFKGYNFVDDHGHPLDSCDDFRDLVALASEAHTLYEPTATPRPPVDMALSTT
jgi:hypothetical protein